MLPTHVLFMERTQRFRAHLVQDFPRTTRTDLTLSLLTLDSIEVETHCRKFIFWDSCVGSQDVVGLKKFY